MCSSSTPSPLQSTHSSDWKNTFKEYALDFKSNTQRSELFDFLISSRISFKTKSSASSSSTLQQNASNNNLASTSNGTNPNLSRLQVTDSEGK